MNPNNVVGTPNVQAQPAAPAAPAAPVAPAEPAVPAEPEVNPMTMGPKKSSKGGVIAAILFAILAAGGIGFGVYTMMNSKKQEDALNDQITTLKKQNAELMDQIAEGGGSGSGSDSDSDTTVNTKDYIYVGEWGIKIKKPENWQETIREYGFYNGYPQSVDGFDIIWGSSHWEGASISQLPGASSCSNVTSSYDVCFELDEKVYTIQKNDGQYDGVPPTGFYEFVTNPDNYSTI